MFPVLLKLCLAALKFIGELSGPIFVAANALNNTDSDGAGRTSARKSSMSMNLGLNHRRF